MGKHKIIKSAAAVALTASVVATAAPGASAASYKTNAKDQLVHTSTGKLVKGWKVFGGKLYKNGKLAPAKKYKIIGTGAAQKLFYGPTLKKGYKTASSKTLLFKDGKLADGWKQAGKGERLYKNGKLDKGYTVYTNVEGDKFLYQNGKLKKGQKTANRGGETLLFVDGKLAKGYVLHEASKTLFNNGKVAEGLVKYPETDGKFYNDGKLANGEINGAEYKDGVLVAKDIASVKAINGTTVEVTFKEAQKADDVKAADYKIEGLEVKNAAVKQTDSKVVVLTTSAQEAAKEYTLVYKEADTKTFTGVSAVIPTGIALTKASQQGVIGKEVTVEAQVKVAEGQSKAGIPVTIVVDSNKDSNGGSSENNIAKDYKVEVYTDENGVAKYSYTQYASNSEDTVYAYPTGDASVKSVAGKVYWGQEARLSLEQVTTGSTFANDSKVVYKVKTTEDVSAVYVAYKENVDVTPEKVVSGVQVVDTNVTSDSSKYPSQLTTGAVKFVKVLVNAKGEATFTLQGTEASVTPIVFVDGTDGNLKDGLKKLGATELQATTSAITFTKSFSNQFAVVGEKSANAATIKAGTVVENKTAGTDFGGRDFTVTVTDKDGNLAKAGTVVNVGFKDGDFSTEAGKAIYAQNIKGEFVKVTKANAQTAGTFQATVGKDGKATFRIIGEKDAFAKPTVFFDNGQGNATKAGQLDDTDLQTTVAEYTYFGTAEVTNASLKTNAAVNGKVSTDATAKFTYQALDQNDKPYTTNPAQYTATFQVTATDTDVTVVGKGEVKAGQTRSFQVTATTASEAVLEITSVKAGTVEVQASASQSSLPNQTAKVEFTKALTAQEQAVATINALNGQATLAVYNAAGIIGVTSTNLANVQGAVQLAKAQKGTDLLAKEIQAAVTAAVPTDVKAAEVETALKDAQKLVDAIPTYVANPSNLEAVEKAIADAEAAIADVKALDNAVTEAPSATALNVKAIGTQKLVTAKTAIAGVKAATALTDAQAAVDAIPALAGDKSNLAAVKTAVAKAEKAIADAKALDNAVTEAPGATALNVKAIGTQKLATAKTAIADAEAIAFLENADVKAAGLIAVTSVIPRDEATQALLDKAFAEYKKLSTEAKASTETATWDLATATPTTAPTVAQVFAHLKDLNDALK
ncbi:hypothetical protein ACFSY7_04515 [Kurthia populi]|uniref:Uncharacterized protein n=1 Tax=Kurthia populi TaxID=1562132 RepID=A0ABW5XXS9_9BACL